MHAARASAVLVLAACHSVFGLEPLEPPPEPPEFVAFGPAVPLEGIVTTGEDDDASMTDDMLEIYLLRNSDIWSSTRSSTEAAWSVSAVVTELSTATTELRPAVSADGLTIYFGRGPMRPYYDIYVATRVSRSAPWGPPVLLALDLNQPATAELPGWSSPDGSTLFVESDAGVNHKIFVATRVGTEPFTSSPFTEIDFGNTDGAPWATADGSTLVFASDRSGPQSIWEAIESDGTWFLQRHVELDSAVVRGTPWLSADGSVIVFTGTRAGGTDDELYIATR